MALVEANVKSLDMKRTENEDKLIQDSKRDTDVQNSLLDFVGEGEGEGGMIWENGIETCTISYIKRVANPGQIGRAHV